MPSPKNILLFDLDNTLIEIKDTHNHFDSIIIEIINQKGLELPELEERNKLWRNVDYKILLNAWGFTDPDEFWRIFDEIDFKKRKKRHTKDEIVLFPDVVEVLERLHVDDNVILGLISNTSPPIVDFELELFDLKRFFTYYIALGDNQEQCKPSDFGIFNLIEMMRRKEEFTEPISKKNIYIIGDSPTDIAAGKNAGIKTIYINRKHKRKEQIQPEPDYILNSLHEILKILGV